VDQRAAGASDDMHGLLRSGAVYHAYQVMGGFFGARIRALRDYADLNGVRLVFDVGCGPGHISRHVPPHVKYVGFDTDPGYIEYAWSRFGARGRFVMGAFDAGSAAQYGRPDLLMMNGLLHHLDDAAARSVLSDAAEALAEGGRFISLDGCFVERQHPVSRFLMRRDRGRYVRTAEEYLRLVSVSFPEARLYVRNDLSWVPYTFSVVYARRAASSGLPG